MSDYNALINLRFNKTTGPMDLVPNNWNSKSSGADYTIDLVDYSSAGQFGGNCATFNGETSYISKVSGNFIYLPDDKEFTISLWVNTNLTIANTCYVLLSDGDAEGKSNKLYLHNSSGKIYISLVDRNEYIYKSNDISNAFSHNRWNYIAIVKFLDSENNYKLGIFLNGFLVSSYIDMPNPVNFDKIRAIIGRGYDAINSKMSFFEGKLDDIVIMTNALEIVNDEINIPTDYLINEGDEEDQIIWEDREPEYSRYDQISKLSEWKRKNNKRNTDWMQEGLTPYRIYPLWLQTEEMYFKNGEYYVNRDRHSIKIKVSNIWDNHFFINPSEYKYIELTYDQGFRDKILNAAILFIDGIFIPWSKWHIVKSDKYVTFVIDGFKYDYIVHTIEAIIVPNSAYYSESGFIPNNAVKMFGFTKDGRPDGDDIILSCRDPKVLVFKYENVPGNTKFQVDADIRMKLTASNVLLFNPATNNEAKVNYKIDIGNYLVINETGFFDAYVFINLSHILSEDNASFIPNEPLVREYLDLPYSKYDNTDMIPVNLTNLHDEFDWEPTYNPKYGDKYANSMRYIFNYNRNKYDKIYEEVRPVNNMQFTGTEIKEIQSKSPIMYDKIWTTTYPDDYVFVYEPIRTSDGRVVPGTTSSPKVSPFLLMCAISRDIYEKFDIKNDAYVMIFVNGELPEWYDQVKYVNHSTILFFAGQIEDDDIVEICWFRNICNTIVDYKLNSTKIGYIDNYFYIPKEDLLVYTDRKGYLNLNPILYNIDESESIIELVDNKYKDYGIYIGSRRQFIYERINVYNKSQSLPIPYSFRTGYNVDDYLVFLNGRLLSNSFYKIVVPSLNDNRVKNKIIYFVKPVTVNDRIDLFYIGGTCDKMNTSGDLVIKPIKVQCSYTNQRKFLVPIPYSNYPMEYDTFIVMNKSVRMSIDKYKLTSEEKTRTIIVWDKDTERNIEETVTYNEYYIELMDQDDYLIPGEELVFLFPYYKAEWETIDEPTSDNNLQFITRYAKLPIRSSVVHFSSDYLGNISDSRYIYIFANTDLIDPSNYMITDVNTVVFNMVLEAGTEVAMVIESDRYNLEENNVLLNFSNIVVTEHGQISLDLPTTAVNKEYIFFKNGLLLDSSSYTVHNNKLLLDKYQDDLVPGDLITAVYGVDGGDNKNTINFKSYEITAIAKNTVDIPNYTNIRYTDQNILVFINNEFCPNTYYTVSGNTINFIDNAYYSVVYEDIYAGQYPNDYVFVNDDDRLYIKMELKSNRGEDIVEINDVVTVFIAYKTVNPAAVNYDLGNKEFIRFNESAVKVVENDQTEFTIPYPAIISAPYRDNKFLLFLRGTFIPEEDYEINEDNTILTIKTPYIKLKANDELHFLFCHIYDFTDISKYEYTTTLSNGQHSFSVPSVYSTAIDLANRVILFYGGTYVDSSRYTIDRLTRTIDLKDLPGENDYNRRITVVFLYTGSSVNGSIAMLPQSGYICFNEHYIDRNYNKEMYMIFVNGKKVPKSYMYDITNSIKKILVNIKTRYDLTALSTSPLVTEFKEFYDDEEFLDSYTVTIDPVNNGTLEVTCGDKVYYNTFTAKYADYFSVKYIPNRGYKAGTIRVNGVARNYGNVFDNVSITGTDAIAGEFKTITITQNKNELIYVKCNENTYNDTFADIKGSTIEIYLKADREGYSTGSLTVTGTTVRYDANKKAYIGTIGNTDIDISVSDAVIDTIPFRVLNENMYAQSLVVEFYDAYNTLIGTYADIGHYTYIAYGTRMKFILKSTDDRYKRGEHVGPFKVNNYYMADYSNPLSDLVPEAVSPIKRFYVDIKQNINELVYVDTYPNTEIIDKVEVKTRHIAPFYASSNDMYTVGAEANYGYTIGTIHTSNNRVYGPVSESFSVSISPAVLDTVVLTLAKQAGSTGTLIATLSSGEVVGIGSYIVQRNSIIVVTSIVNGIRTGKAFNISHDQEVIMTNQNEVIFDPELE